MSPSKKIYIDLDDVLGHSTRTFLDIVKQEFGKEINYDSMHSFDLQVSCGLNQEEVDTLLHLGHQPENILGIQPKEDAMPVLEKWTTEGYEIMIVTGRPPSTHESSLTWLTRHSIPFNELIIVDKYGRYETDGTVAITLDELTAITFLFAIEDSLEMATYLVDSMQTPVALMDCPWNRTSSAHPEITRYHHWSEIAEVI